MSGKKIQEQINEINRKPDLILDETSIQRQNREAVNDLIDDVAVIGKDAFRQMITQLDDAGIEMDGEALRCKINAVTNALKETDPPEVEEYSERRLMRELKKPEVKKSPGFIIAFLKKITYIQNQTK